VDPLLLFLAFLVGFVTMFIGAISGGVGLIVRPILVFLGVPVGTILGSVRVAAIPGELPGLILLHRHKRIDWKRSLLLTIPVLIGSALAAITVVAIVKTWLDLLLGILLLIAGMVLLVHRHIGMEEKRVRETRSRNIVAFLGTLVISFFNTIVGGLGPLYTALYVTIYGKSHITASAIWRTAGYLGSIIAAILFIASDLVDWRLAIALGAGFSLGSYFGTKYGLQKGESAVRIIVLVLVFAGACKLLFF
jgi:uncharacterized membrane protein YfcA